MEESSTNKLERLIRDLPDPDGAMRFVDRVKEVHPETFKKLELEEGLLSDVVTLSAFSPLLARTLERHREYFRWLGKTRKEIKLHSKEEILESLARFSLTNSTIEPGLMLSRFRRRELIRIYLKDIRGLGTIAEITEEISNLADAIIEYALRLSVQEMDNRFGTPLFEDENGKKKRSEFCVIALGKLGSGELNYSSDIDLLFMYSEEGSTSGAGPKGTTTNREYFVKVSEFLSKLIGSDSGEGAAYRVDMRLRPHGRVGALATSKSEAVAYYKKEARLWEKQVLIRSRACAGNSGVYESFFEDVAETVFSTELTPSEALASVRRSKQQIDSEHGNRSGFDVKLHPGGIREIEFIAQALQLAYGGNDRWLRSPHTLIAISRSADRGYIDDTELTDLFEAYTFLRKLEHRLQMENGLQTHTVPDSLEKRLVIAQRMGEIFVADFNEKLVKTTDRVREIFERIFGNEAPLPHERSEDIDGLDVRLQEDRQVAEIVTSARKAGSTTTDASIPDLKEFSRRAPVFARLLAANPALIEKMPSPEDVFEGSTATRMLDLVRDAGRLSERLAVMRKVWAEEISRIAAFEVYGKIGFRESLKLQTKLAEISIRAASETTLLTLEKEANQDQIRFVTLGLGKLGGGGMDYGSDLDLVIVHDEERLSPSDSASHLEFYSKAVEIFTRSLSGMTRHGSLYKVDLRLRPDGKNGTVSIGNKAFTKYLSERAAVWEWLAYVKIRSIAGPKVLAAECEIDARESIHSAALRIDPGELLQESREIRRRLEQKKSSRKRSAEIDIKYGDGGLQDVYFAIRYLQLRFDLRDSKGHRGTLDSLKRLREADAIGLEEMMRFKMGYKFLRRLDHYLRLFAGRSSILRTDDNKMLDVLAEAMNLSGPEEMLSTLTGHRIEIHEAFQAVFEIGRS